MTLTIKPVNPQGKGLVAVLDSLQQAKTQLHAPAKNIRQISGELFTSLFILNSQIRFKPKLKQTYWLYLKNNQYRLSLIAPEQWTPTQYGRFIGACELQTDLTWTLELSRDCSNDRAFILEIARQRSRLEEKMQQAEKLDDVLPVYLESLSYYPRLLASALAYSLRQSMQKSGISGLSFQQAKKRLTTDTNQNLFG
ncbi:DUF2452 domain-containing protein [Methylomonas sp. MgM2]